MKWLFSAVACLLLTYSTAMPHPHPPTNGANEAPDSCYVTYWECYGAHTSLDEFPEPAFGPIAYVDGQSTTGISGHVSEFEYDAAVTGVPVKFMVFQPEGSENVLRRTHEFYHTATSTGLQKVHVDLEVRVRSRFGFEITGIAQDQRIPINYRVGQSDGGNYRSFMSYTQAEDIFTFDSKDVNMQFKFRLCYDTKRDEINCPYSSTTAVTSTTTYTTTPEVECEPLIVPQHGLVVYSNYVAVGSEALISCNSGYSLIGGMFSRVCGADGLWSGLQPWCEAITSSTTATTSTTTSEGTLAPLVTNPCTEEAIKAHHFYHPYPKDIRKFIQCDEHGGKFVMPCGAGTVWDQSILTCNHDDRTGYPGYDGGNSDRIQLGYENPCTEAAIVSYQFYHPYPLDAAKFIQCDEHGGSFVMPCGAGTLWDQSLLTCNHALGGTILPEEY